MEPQTDGTDVLEYPNRKVSNVQLNEYRYGEKQIKSMIRQGVSDHPVANNHYPFIEADTEIVFVTKSGAQFRLENIAFVSVTTKYDDTESVDAAYAELKELKKKITSPDHAFVEMLVNTRNEAAAKLTS